MFCAHLPYVTRTLLKKVAFFGNFMLPKTIIRSRKSVGSPLIETVLKKVSIFGIIILPKIFTVYVQSVGAPLIDN